MTESAPQPPESSDDEAALARAVRAFKAGDFASTRRQLGRLKQQPELPASLRSQVDELWRRTGSDPIAVWAAVGSVVLFLVVVYLTYWR
jgi:hypothetical protein